MTKQEQVASRVSCGYHACISVSRILKIDGISLGKYDYWGPVRYTVRQTAKGRWVWERGEEIGGHYRNEQRAYPEALEIAEMKRLPFLPGIRHEHDVTHGQWIPINDNE